MVSRVLLDDLRAFIARRCDELGVPGVAVGIVDGDSSTVVTHGHPTVGDLRPVSGTTLFQIGSVSKPLTALVVTSLVAEGLLRYDTPVADVLGTTSLPSVTVEQLLTHRLGLDGDALLTRPPRVPTPGGAVEALVDADPLGTPGGPFSYSNAAFSVLARVIEVVDQRPFAEVLRRRLLRPLRMRRTLTTADEAITHTVALPHDSRPGAPEPVPGGMGWQPRWELGAHDTAPAGMISCADDLVSLLRSLLGAEGARTPVPPDAVATSFEPVAPVSSREQIAQGWLVRDVGGDRRIWHPGVTAGYCAVLALVPTRRFGWAVLTNGTAGAHLHREVGELLTGTAPPPPAERGEPGEPGEAVAGTYAGGLGRTTATVEPDGAVWLTQTPHDDGRWQPFPDPPARLWRRGDELMGTADDGTSMIVPLGIAADGSVEWIRWNRRLRTRVG